MATVVNKTVKSSGGNYASLNAFDAGEQRDLTAVDEIARATCYNFVDNTAATLDGWVTDAARYIDITTNDAHGGVWNTSVYRLAAPDGSNCLQLRANHVHIAGLQVYLTNSGAANRRGIVADTQDAGAYIYITHCILAAALSGSALDIGILAVDTDVSMLIRNTLIYNFINAGAGAGYGIQSYWGTVACQNVTIVDSDYGFRQASTGTLTCTNCGAAYCSTAFSGTITQDHCSSSNPTFENYGSDDFHLARADTVWRKNGDNLSAVGFYDDIDGETRGDVWDIGADEYTDVTSLPPTTLAPTTLAPTTLAPTTLAPTTLAPTTLAPTTAAPTTIAPTTLPANCGSPITIWTQGSLLNTTATQRSYRQAIKDSRITDPGFDGGYIRVQFKAGSGGQLDVTGAAIGVRDGVSEDYVAGTQVRLTFSGANGFSISASSTIWSDWVSYPDFDGAVSHLLCWDEQGSYHNVSLTSLNVAYTTYRKDGSYNECLVAAPDGYSAVSYEYVAPEIQVCQFLGTTVAPTTLAPTTVPTTLAPTTLPTTSAPTTVPTTVPTTLPTTLAPTTLAPTTLAPTTPAPCDIFWDDFETGDLSKWSTTSGAAVSAVAPWEGSYCGDIKDEDDYVEKNLANFTELYVSFFWKPAAGWTGTQASLISTRNSAIGTTFHELGLFFYASNRKIYVYRSSANIAVSADGVLTDDWQRIDWYLKIDNTVGRCVVKHNGVTVIDFTGDTLHIYTTHNRLRFGKMSTFSNSDSFCYIDNVCVSTTGYQDGTTVPPTTLAPTTLAPTTVAPTTLAPTTLAPTPAPTTIAPTPAPTTLAPTTLAPTVAPTTIAPTTVAPTTPASTTVAPTTTLTTLAPTTIWVCVKEEESEIVTEVAALSLINETISDESKINKEIYTDGDICW